LITAVYAQNVNSNALMVKKDLNVFSSENQPEGACWTAACPLKTCKKNLKYDRQCPSIWLSVLRPTVCLSLSVYQSSPSIWQCLLPSY